MEAQKPPNSNLGQHEQSKVRHSTGKSDYRVITEEPDMLSLETEINRHTCSQLILTKRTINMPRRMGSLFNKQYQEGSCYFYSMQKNNSRWTQGLKERADTLKLLGKIEMK